MWTGSGAINCAHCDGDHATHECDQHVTDSADIASLLQETPAPQAKLEPTASFEDVWRAWVDNERGTSLTKQDIRARCHLIQDPPLGFQIQDRDQVKQFIDQTSFPKTQLNEDQVELFDGRTLAGDALRAQIKNLSDLQAQLVKNYKNPFMATLHA